MSVSGLSKGLVLLVVGMTMSVDTVLSQTRAKTQAEVVKSINGNAFNAATGNASETYKYGAAALEECSLKWTEEHERREGGEIILRELIDVIVPLERINPRTITNERLKSSGYVVSLATKSPRGIVTIQRMKWGDNPATTSSGFSDQRGIYFRDRDTAERVARSIRYFVRVCRKG